MQRRYMRHNEFCTMLPIVIGVTYFTTHSTKILTDSIIIQTKKKSILHEIKET